MSKIFRISEASLGEGAAAYRKNVKHMVTLCSNQTYDQLVQQMVTVIYQKYKNRPQQ